jgi:rhamnogalacturonyl hydrolase YesR
MTKNKSRLLIAVLILSIGINLLFYITDVHSILINKFFKDEYIQKISLAEYKLKIVDAGLNMALSDKLLMPIGDKQNIYEKLSKLINRPKNELVYKAFLYAGIVKFGTQGKDDTLLLNNINGIISKKLLKEDGTLNFDLNLVDQVPLGLALIDLDMFYKGTKYKKAAKEIFNYLQKHITTENNLILYREHSNFQCTDALGMVCPFLYKYGKIYHDSTALSIANNQILYYLKNGLDYNSHLPFHGISVHNKLRLGPVNWGRGIGWYTLALAYSVYYTNINNNPNYTLFSNELNYIYNELMLLRVKKYWGQFISGDPDDKIDTSTTAMLLYAFALAGKKVYNEQELVDLFKGYTNTKGYLDFTSGDTYAINRYSEQIGKSELSQGMLLSLFSLYK